MWNKISFLPFKPSQLWFNCARWKLKKKEGVAGVSIPPQSKDIGTGFIKFERIVQQLLYMRKGRPFFFLFFKTSLVNNKSIFQSEL